ncbi:MAG: AMP-binding protein, partial [Clostridia bacterium]|nr:AMP-binding protein [Clostridia bacterium]
MATKIERITRVLDQPEAKTVPGMLFDSARLYPTKDVFRYRRDGADCAVTYSAFERLVRALSCAFSERALPTFHVALIGEKSPEWIAVYLAVVAAGGVIVPLDRELDRAQIASFVREADCDAAVYTNTYREVFESDDERLSELKLRVRLVTDCPTEAILSEQTHKTEEIPALGDLARRGARLLDGGAESAPVLDCDRLAVLLFTSGTTGTAKMVMLSQNNILFCCNRGIKYVAVTPDDVFLSILPLHHTYEMSCGILVALLRGCTVAINDRITSVLSDFKRFSPSVICVVPTVLGVMYKKILETARKEGKEKTLLVGRALSGALMHLGIDVRRKIFATVLAAFGGRLRLVVSGGAACSAELIANMEAFGLKVSQAYGITECAPGVAMIPHDVTNYASCGLPIVGQQIIIDRAHPDDETGEIVIKGGNVMLGYYKNEEATRDVLTSRGWFYSGDCGYLDPDGFLYITGRKKNVLVLDSGKNVFPEEIEEYLEPIFGIRDCMVTTTKRDDGLLQLTAIIFPDFDALKEKAVEGDDAL